MLVKYIAICDEQNNPTSYFDGNVFGKNQPKLYNPSEYSTCNVIYGQYFSRHPNENVRLMEVEITIPALQPSTESILESSLTGNQASTEPNRDTLETATT
ncbi:hypothetical protein [Floridanema aerugineum]|uniref:Uncharacterized protein n=1 Tax=Floridaenema aerugineum BLCC-F46 TaxID=3153654 RepID=A0ABV4XDK6_9CYAN